MKKPKEEKIDLKIDFKYNLGIYWEFLSKYKILFFVILSLVFLFEALQVTEKYILKIIIDNGTKFSEGGLDYNIFTKILLIAALVYIGIIIIRTINRWFYLHFINRIEANIIVELKRKFFSHIIGLSHSFHTTHKTGSLISRLTRGGRAMEKMTDAITFNLAPLIFQLIIISSSLILLDKLSALIIGLTVITFISYSLYNQMLQQGASLKANEAEDIEKANISDIFTNIDSIKYFGKEDYIKNKFSKLTKNTRDAFINHWDYFRWFDSGQAIIIGIGTFCLVYFSIVKLMNNEMGIGTIVFIYTIFSGLLGPLFGFMWGMRQFYENMADFNDLFAYGKIEREVKDKENAAELEIKKGEIEFRNISFDYGKRSIFKNFNLKINKNEKIALVGHSGSGKSTLVKLLYRFYDVNSGEILIDGKNIKDFRQESLRGEMAIVPQECILFDDTVYNNITFSRPDSIHNDVIKAIKFSQLDKIIEKFPKKENTIVGERGIKLSGGEKQRVSIARAILADKKVLVLDEATSSLDSETEFEIQKDLQELMKGRTSIIIAHRLSTIMRADRIIVMKEGKIVQIGKHEDLINLEGEYKKLWNLQKGGYIK